MTVSPTPTRAFDWAVTWIDSERFRCERAFYRVWGRFWNRIGWVSGTIFDTTSCMQREGGVGLHNSVERAHHGVIFLVPWLRG